MVNEKERKEFVNLVDEEIRKLNELYKTHKPSLPDKTLLPDNPDMTPVFDDTGVNINVSYPYSEEYNYQTYLEPINLDRERENDLLLGNGFIVSTHKPIQKEIKAPNGIFSSKFGQTLSDMNPFIDRYKCDCPTGGLRSRINNGVTCPVCGKKVRYVDDNFNYFGWMILNNYYIIHPNLYKDLESLIGPQRLINILDIEDMKDEDGHSIDKANDSEDKKYSPHRKDKGANEPFFGIGMIEFKNRIQEICDYYLSISTVASKKSLYYDHIMKYKDILFTQSIPVYTTHLRPFEVADKKNFSFEGTNGMYNMMSKFVTMLNNDSLKIFRKPKEKNQLLFDLQMEYNKLYREIDNILSGKKGNVRQLAGGRMNFSSRDVIIQNPKLRIDEVTLPYACLVDILQQQIINVLVKTYNMSYNDAYAKWYRANIDVDQTIVQIIEGLMFSNPRGLPVINKMKNKDFI